MNQAAQILIAIGAVYVLIAACRSRFRRPKCPTCGARMSRADSGWQCTPCWNGYERAQAAGRGGGRWNPGTWS